ncbi:MAG: sigma-70 family RNA polymerase sigma factor [Planctomycetes bacterium]|nr:sigma-70 family RNA polymerase sigma factor [Planctomycetota bacterium]
MSIDTSTSERFTRLWTRHQPDIAQFVAAAVPDANQVDDVLQDVAVAVLRLFDRYDPARSFIAWAIGIAKLEVVMSKRRHARNRTMLLPDALEAVAVACVELAPEVEPRERALRSCLQEVEGPARELLRLRYEETLTPGEMAGRVGKPAGTVRVMLHRIRTSLERCVDRRLAGGT